MHFCVWLQTECVEVLLSLSICDSLWAMRCLLKNKLSDRDGHYFQSCTMQQLYDWVVVQSYTKAARVFAVGVAARLVFWRLRVFVVQSSFAPTSNDAPRVNNQSYNWQSRDKASAASLGAGRLIFLIPDSLILMTKNLLCTARISAAESQILSSWLHSSYHMSK